MSVPSGRRPTMSVKVPPRSIQNPKPPRLRSRFLAGMRACPVDGACCPACRALDKSPGSVAWKTVAVLRARRHHPGKLRGSMRIFLDRLYLFAGYVAGAFLCPDFRDHDGDVARAAGRAQYSRRLTTSRPGAWPQWPFSASRTPSSAARLSVSACCSNSLPAANAGYWNYARSVSRRPLRSTSPGTPWRWPTTPGVSTTGHRACCRIPLWIPQLGYCGGLVILAIALIDEWVHVACGNKPTYEKSQPTVAR